MNQFTKPYDLTLEIRPEYLYARVTSQATSQAMVVAYLHEMIGRCKKLGVTRLLLERDIPTALDESEIYFSGTDFVHTGLEDIKLAIVDERPENTEQLELAILVQNNRGANIQLFPNIEEAEAWLLKSLPHLAHIEKPKE
jgi:hypothetical protein